MSSHVAWDVRVRGTGAVGRTLALALARAGWRVGLGGAVAHASGGADVRAYALNHASRALLQGLRVWDALPREAITPIDAMHVRGDGRGTLDFTAYQQCVEALGWIVDAASLDRALDEAVRFAPGVHPAGDDEPAALVAVCEGRDSAWRASHGVQWTRHGYGQTAVAARLVSDRPHGGVARQWFRGPDVLALLPMDGPRAGHGLALVWSLPAAQAQACLALDEAAFCEQLQGACDDGVGTLQLVSPRAHWPLAVARAHPWCGPGWVLLGDAAHTVHPLAGQGLNLGLADVAALVEVLSQRETWRPLGDEKLLRRYARRRSLPTWAMQQLTDGLLHLFEQPATPWKELRNGGLSLFDAASPLKRWMVRQALGA